MPRYFFDIADGTLVHDAVGSELSGRSAVEDLTLKTFADMVRDRIVSLHDGPMTISVRDQSGIPVYRATLNLQAEWIEPGLEAAEDADRS